MNTWASKGTLQGKQGWCEFWVGVSGQYFKFIGDTMHDPEWREVIRHRNEKVILKEQFVRWYKERYRETSRGVS